MSLKNCLNKFSLTPTDKTFIPMTDRRDLLESVTAYVAENKSQKDAEIQSVRDRLAELRDEEKRIEAEVSDAWAKKNVNQELDKKIESFAETLPKASDGSFKGSRGKFYEDLKKTVTELISMAEDGRASKGWYKETVDQLMKSFNGNKGAVERFLQVIAITSANTEVKANFTIAEKALLQFAFGHEIDVKNRQTNNKLNDLLYFGIPWEGRKTNTFYTNFMEELYGTASKDTTQDIHMGRRILGVDQLSNSEYTFSDSVTKFAAEAVGMKPIEAQAAIWVSQKARSLYENYIEKDFHVGMSDEGKRRFAMAEASIHYGKVAEERGWFFPPEGLDLSESEDQRAKGFNVTAEVKPSTKLTIGQRLQQLSTKALREFQKEALEKTFGSRGVSSFFEAFGLNRSKYRIIDGVGGYDGTITPNVIFTLNTTKSLAENLAKAWMYIFKQDAVPFFRSDKKLLDDESAALGGLFRFTKPLSATQERIVFDALRDNIHPGVGYTKTGPNEIVVINFRGEEGPFLMPDDQFRERLDTLSEMGIMGLEVEKYGQFGAETGYPYHDWESEPDGARLLDQTSPTGGRPILQERVRHWGDRFANFASKAAKESRPVDLAAHEAATSPLNDKPLPTKGQILGGNAELGHIRISGLDISIENPQDSIREDKNNTPPKWRRKMRAHYGYIKGTVGKDKDHVDIFVKPGIETDYSGPVFVIDQKKLNGHFDEHKVMLGWQNEQEAKAAYLENYQAGWDGLKSINAMSLAEFKTWLSGDTTKPAAERRALGGGMPREALQAHISKVMRDWKDGIRVIVTTRADVPFATSRDAQGAFHGGVAYLFHENIPSKYVGEFVLLHEVYGHRGLRAKLRKRLTPVMNSIYRQNDWIARAADIWAADSINQQKRQGMSEAEWIALATEEAMADVAASESLQSKLPTLNGWDKFLTAIRNAIRSLGFDLEMSDKDIVALLASAREAAISGVEANVPDGESALLKREKITDTPEFKRWFGNSKVVDENGKPLVVYHGTLNAPTVFQVSIGDHDLGPGIYLTKSREVANHYADRWASMFGGEVGEGASVLPVYVAIQKPIYALEPIPDDAIAAARELSRDEEWQDEVASIERSGRIGDIAMGDFESRWFRAFNIAGYDGIIAGEDFDAEVVAWYPEQIKSAIGNNGQFSSDKESILESRSSYSQMWDHVREAPIVGKTVADIFDNDKSLTPWMKTIGTQYHKAVSLANKGLPEFKRVFDIGQQFLSDISSIAIKSESHAPDLFRKINGLTDLFNKNRADSEDISAIAKPLFDGTLHGGSDPLLGKVWTDAELKSQFSLNPKQIGLYRQALNAAAVSVREFNKSIIARTAKDSGVSFNRDLDMLAMADDVKRNINEALSKKMSAARKATLEMALKNIDESTTKAESLIEHGYFPLKRFGEFTVTGKNSKGEVEFFEMFATQSDADAMATELSNQGMTVEKGVLSKKQFMAFGGLNLDAIQLFAKHLNAEHTEAYQEFLKHAINNRSALKQLIRRKGIEGYSKQVDRVLTQFILSNARHAATQYNMGDMRQAVESIDQRYGDVKDEAIDLMQYLQTPNEEASALRGFMFFHFIGGSLASAMVNLTQVPMMTAPYLLGFANASKVVSAINRASKLAFADPAKLGGAIGLALRKAESEGVTAPQEINQMTAVAADRLFAANPKVNAALNAWGKPFQMAEVFNRRTTFIAAFNIALSNGKNHEAAYEFARDTITQTQGVYNKGNRPNFGRGAIGATVMTFKQFSIMYLELFSRLPIKQKLVMLGLLTLAAGVQGLPFADDLNDLIDTIGQWMGFNTNTKKFISTAVGDGPMGKFALNGISAVLPINLQGRMGMNNLIPGSAILKQSETEKGRDVAEILGPAGSLVKSAGDALQGIATGRLEQVVDSVTPVAFKSAYKGFEAMQTGYITDDKGRKVADVSTGEAIGRVVGFNPTTVADQSEKRQFLRQDQNLLSVRTQEVLNDWVDGILKNDPEKIQATRIELMRWNKNNPETPIIIQPSTLKRKIMEARMSADQRFIKAMPKAMKAEALSELRRAQ